MQISGDSDKHAAVFCTPPQQKYTCSSDAALDGFQLLIHSDIYQSHLTEKNIDAYTFFTDDVGKPLLMTKLEADANHFILAQAHRELLNQTDKFTMSIVLSYISIFLNTCQRITIQQSGSKQIQQNQLTKDLVQQLRLFYADNNKALAQPSVAYFAKQLNVTPSHLSDMVRQHNGTSALHMIHDHVIEEAKLLLLSSNKTVSEISYRLGFSYPSYFSRLFKKKTQISPSQFRQSVKSI